MDDLDLGTLPDANILEYNVVKRLKPKEAKATCHLCGKTVVPRVLRRHLRTVHHLHDRLHTCYICDLNFARRDNLLRHLREKHENDPTVNCPTCGATVHRRYLEKHDSARNCRAVSNLAQQDARRAHVESIAGSLRRPGRFNQSTVVDSLHAIEAVKIAIRSSFAELPMTSSPPEIEYILQLWKANYYGTPFTVEVYLKSRTLAVKAIRFHRGHHLERCRVSAYGAVAFLFTERSFLMQRGRIEDQVLFDCVLATFSDRSLSAQYFHLCQKAGQDAINAAMALFYERKRITDQLMVRSFECLMTYCPALIASQRHKSQVISVFAANT